MELRITIGATGSAAEIAIQQEEQSEARACRITSFPCKQKLKGRKKKLTHSYVIFQINQKQTKEKETKKTFTKIKEQKDQQYQ